MGCYINPTFCSKEEWLSKNAIAVKRNPTWSEDKDNLLVCLVDNGPFTAAGIAFSEREFDAFNEPGDNRPKGWCVVPLERLLEVAPDLVHYLKED